MKKKYYKTISCPSCLKVRTVLTSSRGILCNSCANKKSSLGRGIIDITGQSFGKLIALKRIESRKGKSFWECKCECGKTSVHYLGHLKIGNAKSCGCLSRKLNGKSQTLTYKTYDNMIRRCYNSTLPHYKRYGGMGIKVCDRWKESYLNFLEDMGERPIGKTLDRIDPKKDYFKENCRWATPKEQGRNKKNNKIIFYNNKNLCLSEWSELTGIGESTISWRINNGWNLHDVFTREVSPLIKIMKKKKIKIEQ